MDKATYVQSQVACALIDMNGMIAENKIREDQGHTIAYDHDAFMELPEKYNINKDAVFKYLKWG